MKASENKKAQAGFSLVEMLTVVAIVGTLASIAIPSLMRRLEDAKSVEGISDVSKIAAAMTSYYATHGRVPVSADVEETFRGQEERGEPVPTERVADGFGPHWQDVCDGGGVAPTAAIDLYFITNADRYVWEKLYFKPEGQVRYTYQVNAVSDTGVATGQANAIRSRNCGAGGTWTWTVHRFIFEKNADLLAKKGPITLSQ